MQRENKLRVVVLLWDWWTSRNKANAGEVQKMAAEISSFITKHLTDFTSVNIQKTPQPQQPQVWIPPATNLIKINMDATFDVESETGAWGFIARDETGDFLAAAAGKMNHVRSALHSEVITCMRAIEGAADLGAQRISFESDCLTMISALKGRDYDVAELGVLFREARSMCHASFVFSEFMFCPRNCNCVAHVLAQFAIGADEPLHVWANVAPDFVSVLVNADMASQV